VKRSSGSRKTADLSESIHRRLNTYSLAASAAGVSLLALVPRAEGKIVYHPVHKVIGESGIYHLDLNDGVIDFTIDNSFRTRTSAAIHSLFIKGAAGNGVETSAKGFLAAALKAGRRIPNAGKFAGTARMAFQCNGFTSCGTGSTITSGQWANVTNRYLGLKFIIQGKVHYGWARLNVQVSRSQFTITATLTGYAYETIAGKSIIAGKTKGSADESPGEDFSPNASLTNPIPDIPQPASLGMLALGAQVVPMWRRKETQELIGQ
jgi:hypothetical protein